MDQGAQPEETAADHDGGSIQGQVVHSPLSGGLCLPSSVTYRAVRAS